MANKKVKDVKKLRNKQKAKEKLPSCKRRITLCLVTAGILVFALIVGIFVYDNLNTGYVGEYPITKDELEFYKSEEKANVQNYFQKTYGVSLSSSDWNKSIEGEKPNDVLLQYAMDTCTDTKALFILAYENDLIGYVSYEDFLKALDSENASREAAVAAGEIVYGLVSFSASEYMGHLRTNLKTELKSKLSANEGDELYVADSEIEQYFLENQEDWLTNGTTLYVTEIQIVSVGSDTAKAVEEQLLEGANADEIIAGSDAELTKVERVFTGTSYQQDVRSCYEVRTAADEMQEGDVKLVDRGDGYSVIRVDAKEVDTDKAFEEYKLRIKETILEEKFAEYFRLYKDQLV